MSKQMRVLVIDIGGSHVKCRVWGESEKAKFDSGKRLTPALLERELRARTAGWKYDAISIGFPGSVIHGKSAANPPNLGGGWTRFNFEKKFKRPVKVINDAAMQALGSYRGGRMLFVGLGTGIGSVLILDDVVVPLELGDLSFSRQKTIAQVLGKKALAKHGPKRWRQAVHLVIPRLAKAFRTDYVVIGGGNVKKLGRLPREAKRGSNDNAFIGGARLWGLTRLNAEPRKHTWVLV